MSLKAKIEAVVYAAEEPVTLAQLVGLFAEEALEWKQTKTAEAASAEEPVPLGEPSPAVEEDTAVQAEAGLKLPEAVAPMIAPQAPEEAVAEPLEETAKEAVDAQDQPEAAEVSSQSVESVNPPAAEPVKAEEDEKRAARQREKEVRDILRWLLDELIEEYANGDRGIEIREIAGGYRLATKPEYHDAVRSFVKKLKPPMKLSLPALETLAVIAYRQPITAPEVSEIRGADSAGVLGSLISRKLVTTAGRKQVVGRPILYKTTKDFLLRFGLKDLNELPSMEEFEKMATGAFAEMDEAMPESSPVSGQAQPEQATTSEVDEAPAAVEPAAEEIAVETAVVEEAVAVVEEDEAPAAEQPTTEDPDLTEAIETAESQEIEPSTAEESSSDFSDEEEQVSEQERTS